MMWTTFQIALILGMLMFSSACIKNDSDPGKKCRMSDLWKAEDVLGNYQQELLNNYRQLYYEDPSAPTDICSDKDIKVSFYVYASNPCSLDDFSSMQGKAYWGPMEKQYVKLSKVVTGGSCYYYGTMTLSLKSFFGDLPGWIGLSVLFVFLTQGDLNTDKTYLLDRTS